LFVSWENWVPTYVRNEIKKKRGIVLDERGRVIPTEGGDAETEGLNQPPGAGNATEKGGAKRGDGKQYNPISNYKPTGNLVYNPDMFEKLEKKIVP